jgi:hypothetical protein
MGSLVQRLGREVEGGHGKPTVGNDNGGPRLLDRVVRADVVAGQAQVGRGQWRSIVSLTLCNRDESAQQV